MKNPKCVVVFLAVMGLAGLALGAGCGSDAPPAAVPDPISVNTLDGSEGVPVDSTFQYVFSRPVNTLTVTASTFFIVENDGICDSTQALDVSVECSSPAECTLTPAELLEYSTTYSICLAGNMQYATGEQFGSSMATFTAEAEGPLSLNNLDGTVDVPVDSSFRYRFLKEINASTVDTSTYFIVPTVDPVICDVANAVASGITCTRWSCTIAPSAYSEYITGYTACLTSAISYTSSFEFNGFMASFTTEEWIISSIKLVRLDDTELELSDRPIPRMVGVRLVLSVAVSDESKRTALEEAVQLFDPDNIAVDGSWTWVDDFTSATFMPTRRLEYRTEYSIDINAGIIPLPSLTRALEDEDLNFTTMTDRDINGDGYADVIVGAYFYDEGSAAGRAYIFHGTALGLDNCDLSGGCSANTTITGKSNTNFLGWNNSSSGDINADGYADVVLGATGYDNSKGQTYILLGSPSGIDNCDLSAGCIPYATVTGVSDSMFGMLTNMAGDVNGDGYDDIVIGAVGFGVLWTGGAFVFHGGPSLAGELNAVTDSNSIISGKGNFDSLGTIASGAGDINGDSYDDILVSTGTARGESYILLGSESGIRDCDLSAECVPHATITGEGAADALGDPASPAGDVDGDGYDDIIVGAYGNDSDKGQAYIFYGSGTGIANCNLETGCVPPTIITGAKNNDLLGYSASTAGDVNGDGYDDVIVGAAGFDNGSAHGRAYVLLGSAAGIGNCDLTPPSTCVPHAAITGKSGGDEAGAPVSSAGDVDGDGYDDIMVGSIGYDSGLYKGQAYLLLGSGTGIGDCNLATCSPDATLTGESNGDWFGEVD